MTSKISLTNLRRENIKHRLGMILLTLFFFFLAVLMFLMSVQNICGREGMKTERILADITDLSYPEKGMGMIAIASAILLAISSFRYLHSRTEVDFYHSLPIRRRTILFLLITNDFVIFTVPLAVVLLVRCIVTAAVGYFSTGFFANTLWAFLCYVMVFLVIYLIMVLAMLMTGHTFIGILGFCVFNGYAPIMLYFLYPSLASTFYATYCGGGGLVELQYFSPVFLAEKLLSAYDVWKGKDHVIPLAVIGVWIIALLILNYILFERRPSEMAGKAMAFPAWNPVIRFLLVVPGAIYVGIALYSVSFTSFKPWIIAGVIIGGFLAHGVIECIYRFDVRGLWSNKRQMLISVVAAFVIVGFFWGDVSGYDKYLPKEEELASIQIDINNNVAFWGKERQGLSGDAMKGELAVLEKAVSENDVNAEICNENNVDISRGYEYFTFIYKLNTGKWVKRQYAFSPELKDELMSQIFDTIEYKRDTYSLYTADWSMVTDIELSYPIENETLDLTKEQKSELFRCYLEDHAALNYKTAKTTLPFGQLLLTHRYDEENSQYVSSYIEDTDAYFIYPTFKKTIHYLRDELKVELKTSMKDIDITHLEISRYNEETEARESFDIYDKEFIDSIKDKLCYGDDMWLYGIEAADTSIDISATIPTGGDEESCVVYADSETVEKIKEQGTFE